MESKKSKTNEETKQKRNRPTDTKNKLLVAKVKGGGEVWEKNKKSNLGMVFLLQSEVKMNFICFVMVFLRPTTLLTRFIPAVVHAGCLRLE